ncbi:MAG: glycosyltransferase family 4 protein [bacterium]|nr:glycosyltransferase family 4 protein [bacterium]
MHILMYGWEYPPKFNGGLGIACQGMSKALTDKGHEVTFVLPKLQDIELDDATHLVDVSSIKEEEIIKTRKEYDITYHEIGSKLMPYLSVKDFRKSAKTIKKTETKKSVIPTSTEAEISLLKKIQLTGEYNKDIMAEMTKYAVMSTTILKDRNFDVIHAHDWMSFKAGLIAKKILKIPLIVHIHSTEWDRNGAFVNPEVEKIEKEGFEKSDQIIAVSDRVKQQLVEHYKVDENKITVVPNGISSKDFTKKKASTSSKTKNIGFIGRLVDQKGPQKFVDIARDLSSIMSDTKFFIAGQGYLNEDLKNKIASLNMSDKIEMLGFLERDELKKLLSKLDLLIVPSISEPFGLVALEGVAAKVPVLVSSHAGILECISLKNADHWNVHEFSKAAEQLLRDLKSAKAYADESFKQLKKLEWSNLIGSTIKVYQKSLKKSK